MTFSVEPRVLFASDIKDPLKGRRVLFSTFFRRILSLPWAVSAFSNLSLQQPSCFLCLCINLSLVRLASLSLTCFVCYNSNPIPHCQYRKVSRLCLLNDLSMAILYLQVSCYRRVANTQLTFLTRTKSAERNGQNTVYPSRVDDTSPKPILRQRPVGTPERSKGAKSQYQSESVSCQRQSSRQPVSVYPYH